MSLFNITYVYVSYTDIDIIQVCYDMIHQYNTHAVEILDNIKYFSRFSLNSYILLITGLETLHNSNR